MAYPSQSMQRHSDAIDALARGLGWFSILLGVTEVLAPRTLTRPLGLTGNEALIRVYGMREITSGVGILLAENPAPWIWSRIAGDALDAATLVAGLTANGGRKGNISVALAAVASVTALDAYCVQKLAIASRQARLTTPMRDYSDRRGFPRPPGEMQGAARDFEIPNDMRPPELMRSFTSM